MYTLIRIITDKKTGNYEVDVVMTTNVYVLCQSKMNEIIRDFYRSAEKENHTLKIGVI